MRGRWKGAANLVMLCFVCGLPAAAADNPVRILLHDGSFVLAQQLPEVRGDRAVFRLHPSGLLTTLEASRIDLEATEQAAAPAPRAKPWIAEPERIRGTLSGGSRAGTSNEAAIPPPVLLLSSEDQAREEHYARRFTELSRRQEALEPLVRTLRADEIEVEGELRRYLGTPRVAGALADKLRAVQAHLAEKEQELQEVRQSIQALLNDAAARAIPVRRLPPSATP